MELDFWDMISDTSVVGYGHLRVSDFYTVTDTCFFSGVNEVGQLVH